MGSRYDYSSEIGATDMSYLAIIVIAVVGLALVGASVRISAGPSKWNPFAKTTEQIPAQLLAFFILWTLVLPLYWLWQWYTQQHPSTPFELQVYQLEHKLVSDLWAAVAVVLGLLFGIKKVGGA